MKGAFKNALNGRVVKYDGRKVSWSELGDPDQFESSVENDAGWNILPDEIIRAAYDHTFEELIFSTSKNAYRMHYVGKPYIFAFVPINLWEKMD